MSVSTDSQTKEYDRLVRQILGTEELPKKSNVEDKLAKLDKARKVSYTVEDKLTGFIERVFDGVRDSIEREASNLK